MTKDFKRATQKQRIARGRNWMLFRAKGAYIHGLYHGETNIYILAALIEYEKARKNLIQVIQGEQGRENPKVAERIRMQSTLYGADICAMTTNSLPLRKSKN